MSFTAMTTSYPDVAALESALDSLPYFTDSTVPAVSIVEVDNVLYYSFSGSAIITANALDERFTDAWFASRHAELADAYLNTYISYLHIFDFAIENPTKGGVVDAFGRTFTAAQAKPIVDAGKEARTVFDDAQTALAKYKAELADANTRAVAGDAKAPTEAAVAQAKVDASNAALNTFSLAILDIRDAWNELSDANLHVSFLQDADKYYQGQLKAAQNAQKAGAPGDKALQEEVDKAQAQVNDTATKLDEAKARLTAALNAYDTAVNALPQATAAEKTAMTAAAAITEKDVAKAPATPAAPTPSPSVSATPGGAN